MWREKCAAAADLSIQLRYRILLLFFYAAGVLRGSLGIHYLCVLVEINVAFKLLRPSANTDGRELIPEELD